VHLETQQRSAWGVAPVSASGAGGDVIRVALHDGEITQIVVRLTIDEALALTAALLKAMSSLSFGLAHLRRPQ
jgi:hypothetical protein